MNSAPLFGDIRRGEGKPANAANQKNEPPPARSGVVSGIAHYGNCIGVPTVGGRGLFRRQTYDGNPLVNVFCLGTLRTSEIRRGAATGVGQSRFFTSATARVAMVSPAPPLPRVI